MWKKTNAYQSIIQQTGFSELSNIIIFLNVLSLFKQSVVAQTVQG
jgi:hypothetical protein